MKIMNKGLKKGYLIHESSTGIYSICRILNEYDTMNEATEDISKLLVNRIKEKNLLKNIVRGKCMNCIIYIRHNISNKIK